MNAGSGEDAVLQDDDGPVSAAKLPALRYGSLCTGIGGLDLAVEAHFGATPAWHSEIEQSVLPVIDRAWPDIPNLGDLKLIDWADIEPVDILTAGYPCQPFSHAGKRKGADDPRHLWPFIAEAVRVLRPRYIVLENVRGHLSLGFDAVLGSLAEAGFDAEWCVLHASDVGACHRRARVWIVATDADRMAGPSSKPAGRGPRPVGEQGEIEGAERLHRPPHLFPTPVVNDMGANKTPEQWDAWCAAMKAKHGNGNGHGPSLSIEAQRLALLPTPTVGDSRNSRNATAGRSAGAKNAHAGVTLSDVAWLGSWGKYEAAVRRWEALTRPAPAPTVERDGRNWLSPSFVEWMMGYPEGWISGLAAPAALKALGNAVVPQQALAACDELAPITTVGEAVA